MHAFVCVCGALHFGSDTFFGCNCYVSDNFLLPVPVLDVYKYVYIILTIIVARRKHLHSIVYLAAKLDRKGSYCRLNGNILKLTEMPDSLYELVEENANFVAQERTETAPIHRNSETRRITGDINIALRQLGFSGIYWTTSYGFKCDQNAGECPLCGKVSHYSNNFRVSEHEPTGDWYVANFSRECRSTKFIQGTKNKLPSFAFVL